MTVSEVTNTHLYLVLKLLADKCILKNKTVIHKNALLT